MSPVRAILSPPSRARLVVNDTCQEWKKLGGRGDDSTCTVALCRRVNDGGLKLRRCHCRRAALLQYVSVLGTWEGSSGHPGVNETVNWQSIQFSGREPEPQLGGQGGGGEGPKVPHKVGLAGWQDARCGG